MVLQAWATIPGLWLCLSRIWDVMNFKLCSFSWKAFIFLSQSTCILLGFINKKFSKRIISVAFHYLWLMQTKSCNILIIQGSHKWWLIGLIFYMINKASNLLLTCVLSCDFPPSLSLFFFSFPLFFLLLPYFSFNFCFYLPSSLSLFLSFLSHLFTSLLFLFPLVSHHLFLSSLLYQSSHPSFYPPPIFKIFIL